MRFGEIIKKAWHITWHYRFLWVLGLFAGITGGSSGGGGGGGNSYNSLGSRSTSSGTSSLGSQFNPAVIRTFLEHWLPAIVVGGLLLFVISIAFAIVGVGARGGLVWAVNEIEEGRKPRLGQAWDAGFARFWSLVGLWFLLMFPIAIAALALVAAILVPLLGPLMRGVTPDPARVFVPMCGILAIGIPVLLVAGLVLGVMYITATRFVVLEGVGAGHAAGESWRAIRARFADHALMYLVNLGLNIAASLVLAIPIVILTVVAVIPAVVAGSTSQWGMLAVVIAIAFVLVMLISFAYAAIWGTFTSALWTIFYRRLTGREIVTPDASPSPHPGPPIPAAPSVPSLEPVTPAQFGSYPAAPPTAPPMALAGPPVAPTPPPTTAPAPAPDAAFVPPQAPPMAPAAPSAPPSAEEPPPHA